MMPKSRRWRDGHADWVNTFESARAPSYYVPTRHEYHAQDSEGYSQVLRVSNDITRAKYLI